MVFDFFEFFYGCDGLVLYILEEMLNFYYGKYYNVYVINFNKMIDGMDLVGVFLEEIVNVVVGDVLKVGLFNNVVQVWNYIFYWYLMKLGGGGVLYGKIVELIDCDFGLYDEFVIQFKVVGGGQFGLGWVWLVLKDGKLVIIKILNVEILLIEVGVMLLLIMDVWEYVYYFDYQNLCLNYMVSFLDNLVNWDFVNQNFVDVFQL